MEQPNRAYQQKLNELLSATPTEVEICGKKRKIHWLRNYAERRITELMLDDSIGEDGYEQKKRNTKVLALVLLMRRWKIIFFYWIYWRWLFYVSEVTPVDVLLVLEEVKKKMTAEASMLCTISLIGMMDTWMTLSREEVRHTQAGLTMAPGTV